MSFEGYQPQQYAGNGQPDDQNQQGLGGQDGGAPGQNNGSNGQSMPFPPADGNGAPQPGQPGPTGDQKTTLW